MRLWRCLAKRSVLVVCIPLIVVAVVAVVANIRRDISPTIGVASRRHHAIDSSERTRATSSDGNDNLSNDEDDVKPIDEDLLDDNLFPADNLVAISRVPTSTRAPLVILGRMHPSAGASRRPTSGQPVIHDPIVSQKSSGKRSQSTSKAADYSAIVAEYFQPLLNDHERVTLRGALSAVVDALDAAGVTFWVDSGTLLGSYRHQDFIPWDDDADLIVRASDRPRARRALDSLGSEYAVHVEKTPTRTPTTGGGGSTNSSAPSMDACWRVYSTRNSTAVVSSLAGTYGFPHVDLIFYAENDSHVWAELIDWWPTMIWPKSGGRGRGAVFPIRRRPLGERLVPVPCDVVGVLRTLYGDAGDSQTEDDSSFSTWCHSPSERHRSRTRLRRARVPCSALADLYSFVVRRRRRDDRRDEEIESLLVGNATVRNVTLRLTDCH